jgi:hypothetical protein
VEHHEPRVLQQRGVARRVAGRRGDEPHSVLDDEVDDRRVAHEQLRDVDAERLVGEVAHLADLVAYRVELTRGRLDDPEAAGVRHRGGELRPRDVAHGCLHDRVLDAEQLRDTSVHGGAR